MKNFWSKFNELVFSPIAILVFAAAYYGVYTYFGPEAGLIPPGYFTNVLAGACIMYMAGFMATISVRLNFPSLYLVLFDLDEFYIKFRISTPTQTELITGLCVYFAFYALSMLALTSML